jgi:hypothetical protein
MGTHKYLIPLILAFFLFSFVANAASWTLNEDWSSFDSSKYGIVTLKSYGFNGTHAICAENSSAGWSLLQLNGTSYAIKPQDEWNISYKMYCYGTCSFALYSIILQNNSIDAYTGNYMNAYLANQNTGIGYGLQENINGINKDQSAIVTPYMRSEATFLVKKVNNATGGYYIEQYMNGTLKRNNTGQFPLANMTLNMDYFIAWSCQIGGGSNHQWAMDYFNLSVKQSTSNTAPSVSITHPANQTTSNARQTVNFTATDDTSSTMSCSLYIDSILNLTNATVANGTASYFAPVWQAGAHSFYVTCNDGSLTGASGTYNFTYLRTLVVTPTQPANDTTTGAVNQSVVFTAADNYYSTFACSMIIDDVASITNSSVINATTTTFTPAWEKGSHHWRVNCSDGEISGSSGTYDLTFNSSLSVLIALPTNNTRSNVNLPVSYEVYDTNHANDSCSLYIDGVLNATQNTLNDTVTLFNPAWSQGIHFFSVNCTDGLDTDASGYYMFDYDTSEPFIQSASPSSFNTTVFAGFTMLIRGNVTDNNLWRVNRTIYYPNATVFMNNYSGDLAPLTTLYAWDDTYNTTTLPNGIYTMHIEGADSHTAEYFAPALSVSEDVNSKRLTYALTYDTVEVALVGGDTKDSVTDVNTEKLPDRYTFEFAFDRPIEAGETSIFRVTSQYPIIYLPDSPYKGHFILAEKYWLDFENYNGDVRVSKVDDYNYDVTITVTDTKEYNIPIEEVGNEIPAKEDATVTGDAASGLTFFSLGGLNEAQLTMTFEVGNCVPDWVCGGYGSCLTNDTALCTAATDNNACGLPYTGDYSEFSPQACNYCARNIVTLNQTACYSSDFTHCYNDTNWAVCCNVTGIPGDCFADTPQPAPVACQIESCSIFAYGSNDITGAATDLIVKGLIGLASVAFLVVFIYVGLWAYNKVKMR